MKSIRRNGKLIPISGGLGISTKHINSTKNIKTTLLISKYQQSPLKIIKKLHLLQKINILWGNLLYILLVKQIINVFIYSLYQNQYGILTGGNIRNKIAPYKILKQYKGR